MLPVPPEENNASEADAHFEEENRRISGEAEAHNKLNSSFVRNMQQEECQRVGVETYRLAIFDTMKKMYDKIRLRLLEIQQADKSQLSRTEKEQLLDLIASEQLHAADIWDCLNRMNSAFQAAVQLQKGQEAAAQAACEVFFDYAENGNVQRRARIVQDAKLSDDLRARNASYLAGVATNMLSIHPRSRRDKKLEEDLLSAVNIALSEYKPVQPATHFANAVSRTIYVPEVDALKHNPLPLDALITDDSPDTFQDAIDPIEKLRHADEYEAVNTRLELDALLSSVSEQDRDLLKLHYLDGYAYKKSPTL